MRMAARMEVHQLVQVDLARVVQIDRLERRADPLVGERVEHLPPPVAGLRERREPRRLVAPHAEHVRVRAEGDEVLRGRRRWWYGGGGKVAAREGWGGGVGGGCTVAFTPSERALTPRAAASIPLNGDACRCAQRCERRREQR